MMNRLTGQLIIVAMLVSAAAAVVAQDDGAVENDKRKHHDGAMRHEGGRMGNPERMLNMMQRHLDLDETQTQQMSNIIDAAKPEMDTLHAALRENREATRSLDTSDADYSVKLQNLSMANADLAGKMTLLHGRLRAEVHAVLTPEQLQKIEERGEHFRGRRHHRDSEETIR
ncbi:MAG: Spy/CpxP family protein refolding chaperone [Woeseiaceae bacterium]|jgi:Spy/CpxP family protein refolding chaperone